MQHEVVVIDLAQFARTAALRIARSIENSVRERGECLLALPCGPLIGRVYDELAELQLPWSEVEFFFTDERCVPIVHPACSYNMAQDRLFSAPRIGNDGVHRIEAERPNHAQTAELYEAQLPERFDLVVLEVGMDGHVASLFPDSPAFDVTDKRVIAVETVQKPVHRITLAPAMLAGARDLVVLAAGRDHARAVARALQSDGDVRQVPARLAKNGLWILDRYAAASRGTVSAAE